MLARVCAREVVFQDTMSKLTKRQFEEMFREEVLPHVVERYEQDGIPDKPARREAWNDTVDAYIRDRTLPEAAGNWTHPRWLKTLRLKIVRTAHATKHAQRSPAQLDREIREALAGRAHATKRDRAADLIASYGTWTSGYSNEDLDRVQGLAGRLTTIDREEGRPAPAVGYSKDRYAQAKQVVEDANRYGNKQQSLRASGRSHATKRARKTKDIHVVQGNYGGGHGWEDVTAEETRKEALARLREYRENESAPFRLIRRREKIA